MNIWAFQRKAKRESIFILFIFTIFFYLVWWGAYELVKIFFAITSKTNHFYILFFSIMTVLIFFLKTNSSVESFLNSLSAKPPDKDDLRHKRALNIVEEISAGAGIYPPELFIFQSYIKNGFSIHRKGKNYIVLSEGLVGNLKRDELEGVIAHEISHILNGDTEIKTFLSSMVASLFFMTTIFPIFGYEDRDRDERVRVRASGKGAFFIVVMYVYFILSYFFSMLVSMMISRKRETLADMKAVELTNNPIGLAKALYLASRDRVNSFSAITNPAFKMLFFLNPTKSSLDENEGLLSNLFSTHPPTKKRIGLLLKLAKTDYKNFLASMYRRTHNVDEKFYVEKDNTYEGPYTLKDIKEKFKDISIINIFSENYGKDILFVKGEPDKGSCPRCGGAFESLYYEDVKISKCRNCGGIVVRAKNLSKILVRKDYDFFNQEKKEKFKKEIQFLRMKKGGVLLPKELDPSPPLKCPYCGRNMTKLFINYSMPVVVDYCAVCGIYFFDKGELELIQ